jgi:cobalt-zinc-cadmium efflux system outer membrane protein
MRHHTVATTALVLTIYAASTPAQGESGPWQPSLPSDPLLARLIEESFSARPELQQAEASVRAERERVPQVGALPDPVLSLGIQNDGFKEIMVGKMDTSYYLVMLSQGLPWPGKRGLRTDVARLTAEQIEANVVRARLTTESDVRRAYLELLLARDRLKLLDALEAVWQRSAGLARTRYQSGEAAQSDVLRAQLELNRLRQRRFALLAAERTTAQTLNRLRGRALDEPIVTTVTIGDIGAPAIPEADAAVNDAMTRSPELAQARLGVTRADRSIALARRERFPDLSVNAGVMPRGSFEPMWQAGISVGLPVWSSRKQSRAVAESRARAEADAEAAKAIDQILRLRVSERRTSLEALLETIRLYRDGLLVQSDATVESTLAQYRVGRVTFASVLEANAGYLNDQEGFLSAIADAQRLVIASFELTLDPVSAAGAAGMGGTAMPGAGSTGGAGAMSSSAASATSAAPSGATSSGM